MRVLLTGGSGFVGRNIKEAFAGRMDVLAPTRRELDLTDERAVQAFFATHSIDAVVHSAVRPGHRNAADPTGQLHINTRMFFNIVRNSERFSKFILLGSGSEYDVRNNLCKVKEDDFDSSVPVDEGGFSKYIISKFISQQSQHMVDLRIFGIFGPHEDYTIRFISNAICKALFNLPITIRQNRLFDYLWIGDLFPILEYCLNNRMKHSAYNVTPDCAIDLLSIAEMVRERSGRRDLPILVGQDGMGLEYSGDNARLHAERSGISFTPITHAIDRLYSWYERSINLIDPDRLLVDK